MGLFNIRKSGLLLMAGLLLSCGTDEHQQVVMETTMGNITLELYMEEAPLSAANFLSLVDQGVYDSAIFYRVVRMDNQPHNEVKIEVIQGGLYQDELIDAHSPIRHETTEETGISPLDGVISMARMGPGTASTEFFICLGDQPSLDFGGRRNPDGQGFSAFGKVTGGMNVVRDIQAQPDSGQYLKNPVIIHSIRRSP